MARDIWFGFGFCFNNLASCDMMHSTVCRYRDLQPKVPGFGSKFFPNSAGTTLVKSFNFALITGKRGQVITY